MKPTAAMSAGVFILLVGSASGATTSTLNALDALNASSAHGAFYHNSVKHSGSPTVIVPMTIREMRSQELAPKDHVLPDIAKQKPRPKDRVVPQPRNSPNDDGRQSWGELPGWVKGVVIASGSVATTMMGLLAWAALVI